MVNVCTCSTVACTGYGLTTRLFVALVLFMSQGYFRSTRSLRQGVMLAGMTPWHTRLSSSISALLKREFLLDSWVRLKGRKRDLLHLFIFSVASCHDNRLASSDCYANGVTFHGDSLMQMTINHSMLAESTLATVKPLNFRHSNFEDKKLFSILWPNLLRTKLFAIEYRRSGFDCGFLIIVNCEVYLKLAIKESH